MATQVSGNSPTTPTSLTGEERRQCIAIVYDDILRNALLVESASKHYGSVHTFRRSTSPVRLVGVVGELELIQTQMAQKPMLRAEVEMRVRCANKASAEARDLRSTRSTRQRSKCAFQRAVLPLSHKRL